jgi:hypothetical protein
LAATVDDKALVVLGCGIHDLPNLDTGDVGVDARSIEAFHVARKLITIL